MESLYESVNQAKRGRQVYTERKKIMIPQINNEIHDLNIQVSDFRNAYHPTSVRVSCDNSEDDRNKVVTLIIYNFNRKRFKNSKNSHKNEGVALLKSTDHTNIPQSSIGNKINIVIRLRPFLEGESTQGCVKLLNKTGEMILKKDFYQIHFKFDNLLNQTDDQAELP